MRRASEGAVVRAATTCAQRQSDARNAGLWGVLRVRRSEPVGANDVRPMPDSRRQDASLAVTISSVKSHVGTRYAEAFVATAIGGRLVFGRREPRSSAAAGGVRAGYVVRGRGEGAVQRLDHAAKG